jgi:hypothetical protein
VTVPAAILSFGWRESEFMGKATERQNGILLARRPLNMMRDYGPRI